MPQRVPAGPWNSGQVGRVCCRSSITNARGWRTDAFCWWGEGKARGAFGHSIGEGNDVSETILEDIPIFLLFFFHLHTYLYYSPLALVARRTCPLNPSAFRDIRQKSLGHVFLRLSIHYYTWQAFLFCVFAFIFSGIPRILQVMCLRAVESWSPVGLVCSKGAFTYQKLD